MNVSDIDTRIFRKFGNLTAAGTPEVLVCTRTYAEPATQAQRSVVSSSAQDNDTGGTGAAIVRITYLDSNYVRATEDITMTGTTPVNTVATNIRFIEDFYIVKGAAAAGSIRIMTGLAGAGTEIAGIGSASLSANLCHHYVPAGKTAYLIDWSATVSLDCDLKLFSQWRPNDVNLADRVIDLYRLYGIGIVTQNRAAFQTKELGFYLVPEKTYTRVTVVPGAAGAVIRASFNFFEP